MIQGRAVILARGGGEMVQSRMVFGGRGICGGRWIGPISAEFCVWREKGVRIDCLQQF